MENLPEYQDPAAPVSPCPHCQESKVFCYVWPSHSIDESIRILYLCGTCGIMRIF